MRIGFALIAAAAIAAGAVALARGPDGGTGVAEVQRYELRSRFAHRTLPQVAALPPGGYGAYEIARTRPKRFCAVGGHSAATWLDAGDSAPGAFDDAADFERHDVVGLAQERGRRPWRRAALWLDSGDRDPFLTTDRAFASALGIRLRVSPGDHDDDYWHCHYRGYLRFYARALARCR